jgi:hypothetical protein
MARPKTGQTPPISFRPPQQLLKEFDATIEEGRSRSDVLIELMHERVNRKHREKLSRERELLLTAFEPSASECTINQVFTEPAGDFSVRDGLKPYEPSERPVSGEETSG